MCNVEKINQFRGMEIVNFLVDNHKIKGLIYNGIKYIALGEVDKLLETNRAIYETARRNLEVPDRLVLDRYCKIRNEPRFNNSTYVSKQGLEKALDAFSRPYKISKIKPLLEVFNEDNINVSKPTNNDLTSLKECLITALDKLDSVENNLNEFNELKKEVNTLKKQINALASIKKSLKVLGI